MLYIGRIDEMLPVGKEYFFACAVGSSGREATVAGFLAEHGGDACAILGKNDERDTEAEVFEIEASAEEIISHVVLKEEIFDLAFCGFSTLAGVVLESLTITHFGVPLLASCQRLVGFNLLEDVVGHEVVCTPRNVPGVFVELNRRNLPVLFEECGGVGNEDRTGFELWYIYHGCKTKIHILQILLQRYGFMRGREKTALAWHGICYVDNKININNMKKILMLLSFVALSIASHAKEPVTITVNAPSWEKVYAWIWNCPKQFSDQFIPLTKVDDHTWALSLDMDLAAYKNAGLLFVDADSWNCDLKKTSDMQLTNACYAIPMNQKQGQLVKRPNGFVCKELIYECKKIDCK